MGKKWKRVLQHNRWLAAKTGKAEATAAVAPAVTQQTEPTPEAPVVEAPVKAAPKRPARRSAKKSVK
jgi:hypothetical protein